MDGVFPDGFYSTTNLETRVRLDGRWLNVGNPEMDCGLVLERDAARHARAGSTRCRCPTSAPACSSSAAPPASR